jgi:hypothetical protein
MDKLKGGLIVLVSFVYLLNLSGGFIEIPDNIPFVGNVDEFFFSALLVGGLKKYFNIDITGMVGKKLDGKPKNSDSE